MSRAGAIKCLYCQAIYNYCVTVLYSGTASTENGFIDTLLKVVLIKEMSLSMVAVVPIKPPPSPTFVILLDLLSSPKLLPLKFALLLLSTLKILPCAPLHLLPLLQQPLQIPF